MKKKLVIPDFDFADSKYKSFSISEEGTLTINMQSWQEDPFKIVFLNVIQFTYKIGSVPKDLFESLESSLFLNEALSLEYENIPSNHPFKHFQLEDIYDFAFIEVVAESVRLIKC